MRMTLNRQAIEALKTGEIRQDRMTPHLEIRAGKRVKTWCWRGRVTGQQRRRELGEYPAMTLEAARDKANAINRAISEGRNPFAEPEKPKAEVVFGALGVGAQPDAGFVAEYFTRHAQPYKAARSVEDDRWLLKKYVPADWRDRALSSITREEIEGLHKTIAREHAGRSKGHYAANRTMRLLRCMFNLARDWGRSQGDNPAARVRLFKEAKRERYLTPDELGRINAALVAETDWRWRGYFPLALMLGTRRSELLAARWEHIDFERRTITIPKTKAGRPHTLPLPSPAVDILAGLPSRLDGDEASEWVFPCNEAEGHKSKSGHIEEPGIAWRRIRERAKVADCRIHDLRHTLASWLVATGSGLPLIGKALNHSQIATTERYAHLALEPVRVALEANAQRMFPTLPTLALPEPEPAGAHQPAARRERPAEGAESVATA
jgi:integrase